MTTETYTIASNNRVRLYPDSGDSSVPSSSAHNSHANGNDATNSTTPATASTDLTGYDEEQIRLMEEVCIVIDENDVPTGSGSKKRCHLVANIEQGLLHRAFSVFLFDSQGRLLLQQRAAEKITFPNMWTNTCCSHPLSIPEETGTTLDESIEGVRRAAQRKLDHELGIKASQIPLEKFKFLTRIHYKASSDEKWGEHEIDYILFIQADVDLATNPNEVQATRYVSEDGLRAMFKDDALHFTPWFQLICKSMLFDWWDKLRKGMRSGDGSGGGLGLGDTKDQEIVRMI